MAMALAWSTTGMTIAIIPLQLSAHGYGNWTGLVIFLAIFAGFLCQPLARRLSNSRALATGLLLTPLGFLFLLSGAWLNSIGLVLLGTTLSSASSYGFTYLSALSEFSTRAPENRARATAGMFVYAYVGFSIPVIGSGVLADMFGLLTAMSAFGLLLVAASIAIAAYMFHAPSAQHETRVQN
jgi:MFS family permease